MSCKTLSLLAVCVCFTRTTFFGGADSMPFYIYSSYPYNRMSLHLVRLPGESHCQVTTFTAVQFLLVTKPNQCTASVWDPWEILLVPKHRLPMSWDPLRILPNDLWAVCCYLTINTIPDTLFNWRLGKEFWILFCFAQTMTKIINEKMEDQSCAL